MSRKTSLKKKRQESFVLQQCIAQRGIPRYDALRDPYLDGYFSNPKIKKNLRQTGVIEKKQALSLNRFKKIMTYKNKGPVSFRMKQNRSKSLNKSAHLLFNNDVKLPFLLALAQEQQVVMTEQTVPRRKTYVSHRQSKQI